MNVGTNSEASVGSRIGIWLGLTALAVVSAYSAALLGIYIGLANGPVSGSICRTFDALLVATGLLFLGSLVPLFWRAPTGAVRFGIGYLIVLGAIVAFRSFGS
jgi:hypothetical protein